MVVNMSLGTFLREGIDRLDRLPSEIECSICIELATTEPGFRIRKCGHIFHAECATTWFEGHGMSNNSCPNCRAQLLRSPPTRPAIANDPYDTSEPVLDRLHREDAALARGFRDLDRQTARLRESWSQRQDVISRDVRRLPARAAPGGSPTISRHLSGSKSALPEDASSQPAQDLERASLSGSSSRRAQESVSARETLAPSQNDDAQPPLRTTLEAATRPLVVESQQTARQFCELRDSLAGLRQSNAELSLRLDGLDGIPGRMLRSEHQSRLRLDNIEQSIDRHLNNMEELCAELESQRQAFAMQAVCFGTLRAKYNELLTRLRHLEQRLERRTRAERYLGDADRSRSASPQERTTILRSRTVQRGPAPTRRSTQASAESARITGPDDPAVERFLI